MVQALIEVLKEKGRNPDVIFLTVDDKEVYDALSTEYPMRTINIGISECNAVSVAAGLANAGYKVYIIGGNSFMALRAYEFVRIQLCMQKSNVKVIGIGAGLAISVLGNTQHATEDISALRALPNLCIMTPSTPSEVKNIVNYADILNGPVFIRVGRASGRDFYIENFQWLENRVQNVKEGNKLLIFSTGSILCDVLSVVEEIGDADIGVINVHTIKPLDILGLIKLSNKCQKWLSIEEHTVVGGLGSALSEVIVDYNLNVLLVKMGLQDKFAEGYGTYDDIKKRNGLGKESIYNQCIKMLQEKSG